jgi:hypothetical protein
VGFATTRIAPSSPFGCRREVHVSGCKRLRQHLDRPLDLLGEPRDQRSTSCSARGPGQLTMEIRISRDCARGATRWCGVLSVGGRWLLCPIRRCCGWRWARCGISLLPCLKTDESSATAQVRQLRVYGWRVQATLIGRSTPARVERPCSGLSNLTWPSRFRRAASEAKGRHISRSTGGDSEPGEAQT